MKAYKRQRTPPDIISYALPNALRGEALWLYYRFDLSHSDIEDQLAERGITDSRELIRSWCINLGAIYICRWKRKH